MKTMQEVSEATTADLVAFYNQKTGKNIKKFTDRKTAIAKVGALLPQQRPEPAPKKQPSGSTISEAVRKTWEDKAVRDARRERHGCKVGGNVYRSVRTAFRELGLPDSKHIAFRLILKARGKAEFEGHKFILVKNPAPSAPAQAAAEEAEAVTE